MNKIASVSKSFISSTFTNDISGGHTSNNSISSSLILGVTNSINTYNFSSSIMAGRGLIAKPKNYGNQTWGLCILGNYNKDEETDSTLIVGCGTGGSARANCFEAGYNATDGKYIIIGDTKLTETQLIALLA
jgi:hypothetical protein